METKELLQYMKDAIMQETDILQQERIIAEYDTFQASRKPVLQKEGKPQPPVKKECDQPLFALILTVALAAVGFFLLLCSFNMDPGIGDLFRVLGILSAAIGVPASWYIYVKRRGCREDNEYAAKEYDRSCRQIDKRNEEAQNAYGRNLRDWNHTNTEMHSFMQKPLDESRQLLQRYYSDGLIYPKYCNLPALTSIYEYFVTGRCTELTGPHGAYNLYEDELRKDTVISQLNTVIENLEQIKQNQYMLYQQVKSINENTQVIASELRQIKGYTVEIAQLTALNAYYAALNERNTRITMYYHL